MRSICHLKTNSYRHIKVDYVSHLLFPHIEIQDQIEEPWNKISQVKIKNNNFTKRKKEEEWFMKNQRNLFYKENDTTMNLI